MKRVPESSSVIRLASVMCVKKSSSDRSSAAIR